MFVYELNVCWFESRCSHLLCSRFLNISTSVWFFQNRILFLENCEWRASVEIPLEKGRNSNIHETFRRLSRRWLLKYCQSLQESSRQKKFASVLLCAISIRKRYYKNRSTLISISIRKEKYLCNLANAPSISLVNEIKSAVIFHRYRDDCVELQTTRWLFMTMLVLIER